MGVRRAVFIGCMQIEIERGRFIIFSLSENTQWDVRLKYSSRATTAIFQKSLCTWTIIRVVKHLLLVFPGYSRALPCSIRRGIIYFEKFRLYIKQEYNNTEVNRQSLPR